MCVRTFRGSKQNAPVNQEWLFIRNRGRVRQRGFALLMVLSLMAFVLLLILSMATFVRVESQSAELRQSVYEARQNALQGLQVALGEIQKHLGPDQRVSARADLKDAAGNYDQPYWVGVWADPDVLAGNPTDDPNDDPALLTWLVSGNEGLSSTALAYEPASGMSGITVGTDTVDIVSKGSLASSNATETVSVPKVVLDGGLGAYAYWVSDEGIKANVSSTPADYSARVDDADASLSLLPQRTGFQILDTDFSKWQGKDAPRSKLFDLNTLNGGASVDLHGTFFHDLSAHSKGLLTDTMHGGLKLDLERVIEMNAGEFDRDFLPLVDNDDRMFPSNLPTALGGQLSNKGPRWDVLRVYPQMTRDATTIFPLTAPLEGSDFRPSVCPILSHFQLYACMTVEEDQDKYGVPTGNYRPRMYYMPAVIMWNPYDIAIDGEAIELIYEMDSWNRTVQFGFQAYDLASGLPVSLGNSGRGQFPSIFDHGTVYIRFGIPDHTYEAGRAYVFTPESHAPFVSAKTMNLSLGWRYGYGIYQDSLNSFQNAAKSAGAPGSDFEFEVFRLNPPNENIDQMKMRMETTSGARPIFFNMDRIDFVNLATDENELNWDDPDDNPDEGPLIYPGLNSVGGGPIATTYTSLFGIEVSMIFPELELDSLVGRVKGRLLSNFNIRAQLVDRLQFPNGSNYGREPENRTYNSIFLPGLQYSGTIEEQYTIETSDPGTEYIAYNVMKHTADRAIYFYLPRGDHPFSSVGDLRHIDLVDAQDIKNDLDPRSMAQSGYMRNHGPSFVVGSSHADAFIDFDALYMLDHVNKPYPDYSWLCNYQLWDRFYFSGIDGSGAFEYPLPFGGYLLDESIDAAAPTPADLTELRDFETAATLLRVNGAFNINSTSVDAWAALFAAFYGESSPTLVGTQANTDASPVLSAPVQYGGPYTDGGDTSSPRFHIGYRRLDATQIEALAAAMVAEVKKRGPFTSMAQFVNRSIDPNDKVHDSNAANLTRSPTLAELAADPRLMGALQAAIDTAGLNDDFDDSWYLDKEAAKALEPRALLLPPTAPAAMGAYLAGAPGYLNQGAMLARLAPALSARSDTFTIRAYGETKNPVSGEVDGVAVCEAVVQRIYDYVDRADAADVFPPNNSVNQQFGRRFEIVAFKWLDAGNL